MRVSEVCVWGMPLPRLRLGDCESVWMSEYKQEVDEGNRLSVRDLSWVSATPVGDYVAILATTEASSKVAPSPYILNWRALWRITVVVNSELEAPKCHGLGCVRWYHNVWVLCYRHAREWIPWQVHNQTNRSCTTITTRACSNLLLRVIQYCTKLL
jgi:hypothetical protein